MGDTLRTPSHTGCPCLTKQEVDEINNLELLVCYKYISRSPELNVSWDRFFIAKPVTGYYSGEKEGRFYFDNSPYFETYVMEIEGPYKSFDEVKESSQAYRLAIVNQKMGA